MHADESELCKKCDDSLRNTENIIKIERREDRAKLVFRRHLYY